MVTLLDTLRNALGRELDTDEKEFLDFMSPQGVAKLNSDICKGVNLEQTLSEMRAVFQNMKKRRQLVESTLPETAQSIIQRMNRPPATDEMVLLADVPATVLLSKINIHLHAGEELEDVLEDLAVEHRQKQLLFDAQRLANTEGRSVSISRLAPTVPPVAGATTTSATSLRCNKIRLGLSPIATWFDEKPRTPNQSSPCDIGFASSSVGTSSGSSSSPSLGSSVLTGQLQPSCGSSSSYGNAFGGCPSNSSTPKSALKHSNRRFPTLSSFSSDSACLTADGETPQQQKPTQGQQLLLVSAVACPEAAGSSLPPRQVSFTLQMDDNGNGGGNLDSTSLDSSSQPPRPRRCHRRATSDLSSPIHSPPTSLSSIGSGYSGDSPPRLALGSQSLPTTPTSNSAALKTPLSPFRTRLLSKIKGKVTKLLS